MRWTWLLVLVACGGGSDAQDGGGGADGNAPIDGSNPQDGGTDTATEGSNDGTTLVDLAIAVQEYAGMAPTALAGASVRVESMQLGSMDATTDNAGIAHVNVDLAKGPFDVTAAMAMHQAVSVVGVTGPLAGAIVLAKNAVPTFTLHTVSGSISGKTSGGNKVALDSFWFGTTSTTQNNYSTFFTTSSTSPLMPITALEVDNQNNVINAVQTNAMMRPNGNTTVNITLPGNATGWTTANVTVNFPSTGLVKGSDVASLIGPPPPVGNAFVVKHDGAFHADAWVGIAQTAVPTNNVATVKIQSGTGNFAPSYWMAGWVTSTHFAQVHSTQLANGSITLGAVTALDRNGTTLDDATFTADVTGYDAISLELGGSVMNTPTVCWTVWSAGTKITAHGIPHLPSAVKLADISCVGTITGTVRAMKFEGGSTTPWSETTKVESDVGRQPSVFGPGARP